MIRIGLIGAGPNGAGNLKRLARHSERCRIAAIADPVTDHAEQLAAEHGGARVFDAFEPMLDEVDAVVISSPNWLHPDQAVACAEAGKHVWIEKPMALITADADRICAACDAAGVASFVGFSVRFGGVARTILEGFRDGSLGELRSIWSRRLCNIFKNGRAGWRTDQARSGGVMAELLAHEIDWMIDVTGVPESVYCRVAAAGSDDPRANDHVWLTFGLAGGATGTIEGAQDTQIADYYRGIIGSEGSITDRKWGGEVHRNDADGDRQIDALEGIDKAGNFLDAIEGRAASLADCHRGRLVVHLSERALDSAERGQVVPIEATAVGSPS